MRPEDFWGRVDKNGPTMPGMESQCWIWTGTKPNRSGYFRIRDAGERKLVHRIAYELQFGPIPDEKPCICHRCDNPPCVRHLFAGTTVDNTADKVNKNRQSRGRAHSFPGELHPAAEKSDSDVLQIRVLCASGTQQKKLAIDFSISRQTINDIVRGRRWKHVGGPIKTSRIRVLNETPRNER